MQSKFNSTEKTFGRIIKICGTGIIGHLYLLIDHLQLPLFMIEGSFITWSWATIEVRLLPSCRDWWVGVLSSFLVMFQRDGSQALEKNSLGL